MQEHKQSYQMIKCFLHLYPLFRHLLIFTLDIRQGTTNKKKIDKALCNSPKALQIIPDEVTYGIIIVMIDTRISESLITKDSYTCQYLDSQSQSQLL